MIRQQHESREAVRVAKAALRKAEAPLRAAKREENRRRRAEAKERQKGLSRAPGQRDPAEADRAYMTWLHEWDCIACWIEGPGPTAYRAIEAAHQKHTDKRGAATTSRGADKTCVPLCTWHHRIAPGCCDPAQTKFWNRLRIDIAAFARDFYAAFKAGEPGAAVVTKHLHLRNQPKESVA